MIFNKLLILFCLALLHPRSVLTQDQEIVPCLVGEDTSSTLFCTSDYSPVCAYGSNCGSEQCPGTTVDNACIACYQQGFSYYIQGVCPGDEAQIQQPEEQTIEAPIVSEPTIMTCPTISEEIQVICTTDFNPVCAFSNREETSRGETVANACFACNHFGFDYYIPGPCPESSGEEEFTGEEEYIGEEFSGEEGELSEAEFILEESDVQFACPVISFENTETVCTAEYNPVCAYLFNSNQIGMTVANACEACYSKGYDYYTKGACSF